MNNEAWTLCLLSQCNYLQYESLLFFLNHRFNHLSISIEAINWKQKNRIIPILSRLPLKSVRMLYIFFLFCLLIRSCNDVCPINCYISILQFNFNISIRRSGLIPQIILVIIYNTETDIILDWVFYVGWYGYDSVHLSGFVFHVCLNCLFCIYPTITISLI